MDSRTMKRDEIRHAVDVALAESGYSRGWYYWRGCHLVVLEIPTLTVLRTIHLPSGTSRERFIEHISVLPCPRWPKPIPARVVRQKHKQIDLEDYLRA